MHYKVEIVDYFVGFVRFFYFILFFIDRFNKAMKYKEILILEECLSFVVPLAEKII